MQGEYAPKVSDIVIPIPIFNRSFATTIHSINSEIQYCILAAMVNQVRAYNSWYISSHQLTKRGIFFYDQEREN